MKRAILYARRSSERNDDAYTLTSQIAACRQYAENAEMIVVDEATEEFTGTVHLSERKAGARIWQRLAAHEAEVAFCWGKAYE